MTRWVPSFSSIDVPVAFDAVVIFCCFFVGTEIFKNFLHSRRAVAQSVERATPGEEVSGSIPAVAARSLLVGSVPV